MFFCTKRALLFSFAGSFDRVVVVNRLYWTNLSHWLPNSQIDHPPNTETGELRILSSLYALIDYAWCTSIEGIDLQSLRGVLVISK